MKKRIKTVGTVLLLLLAVSCQKDTISPIYVGEAGEKVEVELSFRLEQPTAPKKNRETKSIHKGLVVEFDSVPNPISTRSDDNTILHNLYIFQFNANGTLSQQPVLIDQVAASSTDNIVQIPVTLTVGENQTLYLVALGKALTDDLRRISSLSALKRYPFTYVDVVDGVNFSKIKTEQDIPFAGKVEGVNVIQFESENKGLIQYNVPEGFTGGISLRRLISKVTLNYAFDVKDYSASGVRLKSVPSQFRIEPSAGDNISYVDMEMQQPDPENTTMQYTPSWYIAPNESGTVESIIIESERYRRFNDDTGLAEAGNAPIQASYFEVWAKQSVSVDYVVYQIYIGNNNTSDFNIKSNNYYTINTLINGEISSVLDDNRIRKFSVNHFAELYCSEYYHYSKPNYYLSGHDIDAHYDFRPIVINTDGRTVTVRIYTDKKCLIPASKDAWLQVSPHPNYTLAKNSNSLSNSVTVNVAVPSKVILYLYNDEYIPSDLSSTTKRTLYVEVITTTLNVPSDIKSTDRFQMDQCPPINIGLFGGEFDESTGYQSNLVMDCIDEGSVNYVAVLPPPLIIKSRYPFGYKNINTTEYETDYAIHGAAATRALAENKNGYLVDNTNAIPQTNGDLYQYNYYNTFPARHCYDMNRDLNGNGAIDDDELKWYLPTINQIMGSWVCYDDLKSWAFEDKWSTNRVYQSGSYVVDQDTSPIRCVRDIK